MARFDIFALTTGSATLILDVQLSLLETMQSRVVIPLLPVEQAPVERIPRLHPLLTLEGDKRYVLMTHQIGTLLKSQLGPPLTNIEAEYRNTIIDAIDFLFQGF